jgi:uncharacterized protein (UPF0548 family)
LADLTYPEIGATAGELPDGYHHVRATRAIGHGRADFDTASAVLLSWQMHQRAGVRKVSGPDVAAQGRDVAFRWLLLRFECRVVSVVDEADRRGFVYGTLPRHPECGEERFVVELHPQTQAVTATITAFSKPSSWMVRAGGPVPRLVQAHMTQRYLRALDARRQR